MKTLLTAAAGLLLASPANAEDPGGIITGMIENDVFTGSDDRYSNGLALSWTSRELSLYPATSFVRQWANFWSFLPSLGDGDEAQYVAWTVSQEMHTPQDLARIIPDPNDQPYAGLFLVDSAFYRLGEKFGEAWQIQLGLVGPITGAESLQKWAHELSGAQEPLGWDSQIQNEIMFNVGYTVGYSFIDNRPPTGRGFRVSPIVNVELGTHVTAIGVGGVAEYGINVPEALAVGGLGNNLKASNAVAAEYEDRWSVVGFLGVGAYAVAHYLPVDGPVFRDGPSVDVDEFATAVNLGVTARRGNFIASFAVTQGATPADDFSGEIDYGVLTFSWLY